MDRQVKNENLMAAFVIMQEASSALSTLEQSLELEYTLLPLNNVLVQNSFLLHKDKEVRLLLAVCFCEIIRILAPKPPFSDEVFKVVTSHFKLTFNE